MTQGRRRPSRHAALAAAVTGLFAAVLAGCAGPSRQAADTVTPSSSATPSRSTPTETSHTQLEETPVTSDSSIVIRLGSLTVRGDLAPSAATVDLVARLPLTLSFRDFGGQEKTAELPAPLPLDGMSRGSAAEPGMIGYYVPDQVLVLYYEPVGYYDGIIPLGTFDDIAGVRDAAAGPGTLELGAE